MSIDFVHLRVHSEFSIVDGLCSVGALSRAAAAAGMAALALTDRQNLFGVVKFYRAARSAGLKPVVGMEALIHGGGGESYPMVLLAQDATGYRNLCVLSSRGYREGRRQGAAGLQGAWLEQHGEGLIALSGAADGDVGTALLAGRDEQARARLRHWLEVFPGRYYLELQRTGRERDEAHVQAAVALAAAEQVPVVATNDVRFLSDEDFDAHEARVCIQQGYTLEDPRRPRRYSPGQFLRTPEQMAELFADLPEALLNSVHIARRCNLELDLGRNVLPDFALPAGMTEDGYLRQQAEAGLRERLARIEAEGEAYRQRLATELDVITQMGFAGYFLIVADFIRWAKDNGVPVGPGRGSGAGSLVAYALGITDLDPLAYDLLFERFLNPERVSMPDFDVDFCMDRRDRVIEYVAQRYGRDKVAQIATHGTMAAKAVVRDVGRVLAHPYGFVDRIAKLIPFEIGITLEKAMEANEDLRALYDTDEAVRAILDLGRKLEGLARNVGRHAGGVVIAPTALTDFTPLYFEDGSSSPVTQLDKDDVESAGLVKFDFLGLRTLTIIDWAVQTIGAGADGERLRIEDIPLDDQATYRLLKAQQTTAVFQLESRGMKDLIRRLQPDCFEDIVALVALFRPGPLQSGMVDDFINRKHGRAAVEYPHPALEAILSPTYGVILYQEQVMQIAQVLAGYTLGGADLLRRAMGKKKAEEMAKQRAVFVGGAVERGVEEAVATHIFDLMEKFAGYGFNKSHSAAYALVSYQTAWLKAHHPAAFMAAVLSSDMDNTDKVVVFIDECRSMGLTVRPPGVNSSEYRFTVDARGRVVYGLGAIKGAGEGAIDALLEARREGGPFADLADLARRADPKRINRRVLEALIKAGALDDLPGSRAGLLRQLPEALKLAEQHAHNRAVGQADMFGLLDGNGADAAPLCLDPTLPEWPEAERLAYEKEALGLYLSGHPIDQYLEELDQYTDGRLAALFPEGGTGRTGQDRRIVVAGLAVEIRTRPGRKGGRMAFVTLDDHSARIEARVFPEVFQDCADRLAVDRVLVLEGSRVYDDFSERLQLNVERVLDLESARAAFARQLTLSLQTEDFVADLLNRLAGVLEPHRAGNCPVAIHYRARSAEAQLLLDEHWQVSPCERLLEELSEMLGRDSVRIEYSKSLRA